MATPRRLIHAVRSLRLGDETAYAGGDLVVSADAAAAIVADPALGSVRIGVASPGDSARIVWPLDVVEPRTFAAGGGGVFPGWVGPARRPARTDLHVLAGAAVLAAGYLPRNQEGLIDLSGPAAERSPFGSTHNVVVEFEPAEGASWEAAEAALRRGVLRLAVHLADAALDAEPDTVEEVAPPAPPGPGDLPRIGALTNLQTQGAFKDVFVYGTTLAKGLATLIDPFDVDAGAVVSGQYGHPALRNPTWVHQNHPVVAALRARDGVDLRFGGLVLAPEPVNLGAKELVSEHAAWLCKAAGLDGVIVTKEGGGNADNDMSLKLDALTDLGIGVLGLFAEMSGPDGTGPPVVAPPLRATAMVSTGNYDDRLQLPAVERALGGARLEVADADATAAVDVPTATLLAALSPLGAGRLRCENAA